MAKKKKINIEKTTRKLIEANSEMIKIRDGKVRWKKKFKKKQVRAARQSCFHWRIDSKGKFDPCLVADESRPGYWYCRICKKSFPIEPLDPTPTGEDPYKAKAEEMLGLVNQIAYWSVRLGGDKSDTEMFLQLKRYLDRFPKVANAVTKRVRKKKDVAEKKRSEDPLDTWGSYNYNVKR